MNSGLDEWNEQPRMSHSEYLRVPRATYRIQFNSQFTIGQATGILEYLEALGVSDLYASPLFPATPGSTHGYDVCCHNRLNPEIGSEEEAEEFFSKLKRMGMGLLLDIVPNHMAAHTANKWWRDVLENGQSSRFAEFFDIQWSSENPLMDGKVLLPVLGDRYGDVLKRGELRLAFENGTFALAYFDHRFPLSPESAQELSRELQALKSGAGGMDTEAFLQRWNSRQNAAGSMNRVEDLHRRQHYRLAFWKVAPEEINYRRFFDITGLISMKVEREEVFAATHQYLFELIKRGVLTGLRVDHPDGLWDPGEYFQRLQIRHEGANAGRLYIAVEKILSSDETLPEHWPVAGTTGYDFLNVVNGLFVSRENEPALTRIYQEFSGEKRELADIVFESKRQVLHSSFPGDFAKLCGCLHKLACLSPTSQDFTKQDLARALEAVLCSMPIYRTYVTPDSVKLSSQELSFLEEAFSKARVRCKGVDGGVFLFLRSVLTLEFARELPKEGQTQVIEFIMKLQQLSGPLMAKGVEDTTFYRYFRLVSLNEVGGDPGKFGCGVTSFHEEMEGRSRRWPQAMLATATHDTKRGEDVRARLNVLSEIPDEWQEAVQRWSRMNSSYRQEVGPTRNDEYLFFQTVVGSWVASNGSEEGLRIYRNRLVEYMRKAIREAKVNTSWIEPKESYESAVEGYVTDCLSSFSNGFIRDCSGFVKTIANYGYLNSLAQLLLKVTAPGVPDFYQGTELWDFSLVDPDNRRAVDFIHRRELLRSLEGRLQREERGALWADLLARPETGEIKMLLTFLLLRFRKGQEALFASGDYRPVSVVGTKAKHIIAYERTLAASSIKVVVPRLIASAGSSGTWPVRKFWSDTFIEAEGPDREYLEIISNIHVKARSGRIELEEVFAKVPVAMLFTAS